VINVNTIQLSQLIESPDPDVVMKEVERVFSYHYPSKFFNRIHHNYIILKKLFDGKLPGYKACNTRYHDLSHTLAALLTTVRLMDGYNIKNEPLPVRLAEDLLNATLLHDTGYIQEDSDPVGTGAKYTTIHVERSIQFLKKNYEAFEVDEEDLEIFADLIQCTGLMVKLDTVPFSSTEEKMAGCILGTADLLGQMSDRQYLEKLIFLYYEFKEANVKGFDTEFDLVRKTLDFYAITRKRLSESYLNVYVFARDHFEKRFGIDRNLYMIAIDRQMDYLRKVIEDDTTNFRHKFKRAAWVHTYAPSK
jgi:hypothetical protein